MAELAILAKRFGMNCGRSHDQRQRETCDGHTFKRNPTGGYVKCQKRPKPILWYVAIRRVGGQHQTSDRVAGMVTTFAGIGSCGDFASVNSIH